MRVIVVGIDGSDGSQDALAWATGQAELTGARVRAVGSWRWPNYVTRLPPGAVAEYCVRHGPCPVVVVRTLAG